MTAQIQTDSPYLPLQIKDVFDQPDIADGLTMNGFKDATHPAIPNRDEHYVFRKDFLREVLAFLKHPMGDALYISGPTGSGKTSGITNVLSRLNWPVQQLTAHGRMELTDLIGHHALRSPEPGAAPEMTFMYGPLAVAMREGHVLLINEVDMMDPAELSGLNDILEGRPLVIGQNGGELIKPHPMFRVVVTGNSLGSGDSTGLYQGVTMQNLAAMDRYRILCVDYPDCDTELAILKKRLGNRMPDTIIVAMIRVANEIRSMFTGGADLAGSISLTMSTRTLTRWSMLSLTYRTHPSNLAYSLDQALLRRAQPEERVAILRVTKDIFGDQWQDL